MNENNKNLLHGPHDMSDKKAVVRESYEQLSSSEGLHWNGVAVQRARVYCFDLKEFSTPFHCFSLLVDGPSSMEVVRDNKIHKVTAAPGYMHIRPANFKVSARSEEPREFVQVGLDQSRLLNAVNGEPLSDNVGFRAALSVNDPQLRALTEALIAEAEAGGPNGSLFVDSLTTALAVHYVTGYADIPDKRSGKESGRLSADHLSRIVDYMEGHLGANLTLGDLADEIGMSKYYFSRVFKEKTGSTPYQFFLTRRLERARRMLLEGKWSITEIAHQLNFSDQSHFSRVFRKKYGINPRAYLEKIS